VDNWRELRSKAERLRWMGAEVEAWPLEQVRQQLVTDRYFGALHHPRGFHIHPLNYAYGMARAAEAAGARIFEETPAIELDPAGVRKRVQTPSAKVRAPHVVLAANVQLGNLMPRLGATVMPLTSYVMVTEPIENLADAVRYQGAVSEESRAGAQLRIIDGNRLQISGGLTAWPARPQLFARLLRRKVRRLFPQLGAVNAADLWSGTFGRTLHQMPQIGEVHPGVWISSGFGPHGLNTSALAGQLIGRGIVEADDTWRLFAPYELVWAGGKAFRAVAQAIHLGARPLAGMRAAWSRRRERSRRRSEQRAEKRRDKVAAAMATGPAALQPARTESKTPRRRGKGEAAASMLAVPTPLEDKPDRKQP
jgi:glycine/D-amino acid oxidase-like deaminating enzyme